MKKSGRKMESITRVLFILTLVMSMLSGAAYAAAPSNDACSAAKQITGVTYTDAIDTLAATTAADDPVMTCTGEVMNKTVWYKFTAPANGTVAADTLGSNYDTVLAAYTGACGSFTSVACTDDDLSVPQSSITLSVTAGTTYYFLAAAYFNDGGQLKLHLNFTETHTTYTSTDVPKAIPDLSTVTSTLTVVSGACTSITDANVHLGITHPFIGDLSISLTHGSTTAVLYNQACATGANMLATFDDEAATTIQCPPNGAYQAEELLRAFDGLDAAGTWTLEVADNLSGDTGTLDSWNISLTCGAGNNDNCSDAKQITGTSYTDIMNTTTATTPLVDPLDPAMSCGTVGQQNKTVWYKYTAPGNGTVTVDTIDSDYDTVLAAYTGACGSFSSVACNNDISTDYVLSSITFPVIAGTTYYLMAADTATDGGMLNLHLNFTEPVSIQLSSATYSVAENGGTVTITATRTGGSSGAVGVSYATANGSAIAGTDYTAASSTLSWANGDSADKTFAVTITNDTLDEPNETFTVTLSSATGSATLGSPAGATVTITDNDPPPTVQFSAASSSGSESITTAVITVNLSTASGQTVTVGYATANGTATAGPDYTATSGTLTFNPGDTSKTINVTVINDTLAENNETFTVTLSGPTNATLGATTVHTYTIIDNDIPPQYTLSVTRTGTGTGTVASSPSGISCGGTCSFSFNQGTLVTLSPTPDVTSVFTGWSGACAGAGVCQVTMNSAKSVTANFTVKATITWNLVSGTRETCVNSASALATALYEAGTDGYPNLIKVVQGTYTGLFAYSGNENFDLNLEGGYAAGCATFSYNPELTILNGDINADTFGDGVVLDLITLNPAGTGNIVVECFHVKNGRNGVDDGGGIRLFTANGHSTITGNVVSGSSAVDGGGIGVETFGGNILLTNNIVYGNTATTNGGGIGAVSASGTITILNNTITGNTGNGGGGVAVGLGTTAHADIQNNIILGNTGTIPDVAMDTLYYQAPPVNQNVPGTFLFDYNDAVVANIVTNPTGVVSVGHNINGTDPQFMDTVNKNYHLQTTSPVIDLGNSAHALLPTVDIDGDNRIIGTAVDIGADEVMPLPGAPIVTANTPTKDTTPTWTWISGGGGNGTFRYRLDNPVLTTGATTTTLKSFTPATALANGSHTLYVQEKNAAGLWSANGSKTVLIDTTLPINGTATATPGSGQIALSWSGFTDALSGIGGYKVVYATGSAPTSCSTGTPLYAGTDATYNHTGLINLTYGYRVCAIDNAGNISTGITKSAKPLPTETDPPTGTIVINSGAEWTKSTAVTLTLSASDDTPPIQMCISNTTSCTVWTAFAATKTWTLTSGNGTKTVNAWFRDTWGNTTPTLTPYSDTISLDATPPVNGTATATPGSGQIALSWSGFTDALSGIGGYKVVYATGSAPTSCSTGTPLYAGTDATYNHTGLINLTYGYRVCAIDNAGNISTGITKSAKPLPTETDPPTGTIVINSGAEWTKSTAVTLTLSASDDTPPIQMCISNTTSCTVWTAFAATKTWTLTSGNGTKTVNAWFRDTWGNTTPTLTPYSDTISLDATPPVNGTATATPGSGQIALSWSGFTDALSGIGGYKVVYATGSAPTSCSTGTPLYAGTDATYNHTGLINLTYGYRVCAIDNAGNISTGITKSAKPLPTETDPPTGTIVINSGAEWTKSTAVTLTLSASDDTPPIQMCISNTTSCTVWTAFAATKTWTLTSGNGTKTVNAWFRDTWGNTTPTLTPYSDTISLDATPPVNGTATATPGSGQIALSWSGFTDALSGIGGYKVVYATGSAPTSCSTGTPLYAGTDATYNHTGLINLTYGYRVCAIDNAGNISTGITKSAKPL